jgi:membrane-bound lytic murein transglycosylase B
MPASPNSVASLWPEAQAAGSRATFDTETRASSRITNCRPDPARTPRDRRAVAGRVRAGADYVLEASIARLAAEGQKLMQKHRTALTAIEARLASPATIMLDLGPRNHTAAHAAP